MELLLDGLEGHLTRSIAVAGVLALLIVGAVWFVWVRGRRMVERGRTSLAAGRHLSLSNRIDDPEPEPEPLPRSTGAAGPRDPAPGGEEQLASKFVREAAVRAAALRDAWDRSYREARGSGAAPGGGAPGADLQTLLDDLLREQRETNALLRQLIDRLGRND